MYLLFLLFTSVLSNQLDLNTVLNGVQFKSENVSFNFKNLSVKDGKVEFDELTINGNNRLEISQNAVSDESDEELFDYPELVETIDETISPCDDFYGHVCQKWIDRHPIPDDETAIGQMDVLTELVTNQITELLESNHTRNREQEIVHQFYQQCVRHKRTPNNRAFVDLLNQLKASRTGNQTMITNYMKQFRPMNFIYDIAVGINDKNSSVRIIQIVPTASSLSYNAYHTPEYRHEYLAMRQFLGELLDLLQFDDIDGEIFGGKAAEYEARIEAFFEIDEKLALLNHESQFNKTYSVVRFSSLDDLYSSVSWRGYFKDFVPENVYEQLQNDDVQLVDHDNIAKIDEMIFSTNETTLKYYLDWQAVMYYGEFLDARYQETMQGFYAAVSGATTQKTEKDCMSSATSLFFDILGKSFVEKHFDVATKEEVTKMVQRLVESFEEMLEMNGWMDDTTKNQAIDKLHAIGKHVGYYDQLFNETWITDKYKNLQFTCNDTYFSQTMKYQKWMQLSGFSKLYNVRTIHEFEFPPTDVNAFYDPSTNGIALTAAILRSPYFNTTLPDSVNYGAIGIAIGHEITHGFDNSGAEFDKYGNRQNWWDLDTLNTFTDYSECFVEQYSNVTVEGSNLTVNGRLTLNENIADNGGIRAAIRTFKKLEALKNVTEKIRGLEKKTPMQLFFYSNAHVWCTNIRPQQLLTRLYSDSHAPEKFRINTVFSNQPEFAEAFNCPLGSRLNPIEKCRVW